MGGTRDNPPVCSCCPEPVTVYGWGREVKINPAVLDVWLADGWSLVAEPDDGGFLPQP